MQHTVQVHHLHIVNMSKYYSNNVQKSLSSDFPEIKVGQLSLFILDVNKGDIST